MNTTDLMKDPFYAAVLFQIETRILIADRKAAAQGITFTDSQVRSVVLRARKAAAGKPPTILTESPRETALAELYAEIQNARGGISVSDSQGATGALSSQDWALSLRAVEDSIRLRTTGSGSRGYLLFLEGFLSRAK